MWVRTHPALNYEDIIGTCHVREAETLEVRA